MPRLPDVLGENCNGFCAGTVPIGEKQKGRKELSFLQSVERTTLILQTASVNKPGAQMSLAARMPHLYTRDLNPATGNMV